MPHLLNDPGVTGRTEHYRRGGYVWERVSFPCTRLQHGDLTIWTRVNERRPSMTEGSCKCRLGAARGKAGLAVLEVTCSDPARIDNALATVRDLSLPNTVVTTSNRWTANTAKRLPWRGTTLSRI